MLAERRFDRLIQRARSAATTPSCLALIVRDGERFHDVTASDVVHL